jgi:DNA-binding winged helix-turn-helix (wHTH) protein
LRYLFEDIALDIERRELLRGADAVPVEPQVFDLLVYLIRNRERVVSRDDLLPSVWAARLVSDSALNTRIHLARWAVGDRGEDQSLIKTFPRKGFRFIGPDREDQGTVSVVARRAQAVAPETIAVPLSLPDRPPPIVGSHMISIMWQCLLKLVG